MKTKITALFIVLLAVFYSCESELDKYYETPGWLKGNAWQVLESKGNHKLFLAAVERSTKDLKYMDLVQGKGIITVMAPTDEAFQNYLDSKGYSSVETMPIDELDKMVGFHLLYYSFSKSDLENYNPRGSGTENKYPGIYYKFRTKSTDGVIEMVDNTVEVGSVTRKVIRKERFLPVYSFNYFGTYGLDAKSNYEYFYPNSTWTGDNGFNVSNASVEDYAIVTDNGYVYTLNQVLEPLETIYNEMKKSPDYDLFRNSYDRFIQFVYDEASTTEYQGTDSLFQQYYSGLTSIANEWTTGSNVPSSIDYANLGNLSSIAYTLFVPDNAAMQAFFNKYWADYYPSLDQVNFIPLVAFLQNHVTVGMLFPSQIESGQYETSLGTTIQIDRNTPDFKKACVNGAIYGLTDVFTPDLFDKVSEMALRDPQYDHFLRMISSTSTFQLLTSDAIQFKLFLPPNSMIINNTTLEGRMISYENKNPRRFGAQQLMIETDDQPQPMSASRMATIANSHIGVELISQKGDEAIYRTPQTYNYIFTKGDRVFSTALYNINDAEISDRIPKAVKYPKTWSNGEAYQLTGADASALVPEHRLFKSMISAPVSSDHPWYMFRYLVEASGMSTQGFPFLQGDRFIIFIPKGDAIVEGANTGKIPFTPQEAVAEFLKPYFIKVSDSNLLDYPFSGTGINTELVSFGRNAQGQNIKFKLTDDGTNLYIEDVKGNKVKVNTYFPRIFSDGAVYMIDGLLEVE